MTIKNNMNDDYKVSCCTTSEELVPSFIVIILIIQTGANNIIFSYMVVDVMSILYDLFLLPYYATI